MLFSRYSSLPSATRRLGPSAAALAMGLAMLVTPIAGLAPGAHASDLDYSQTGTEAGDANYLRIGLAKSAVIRLPSAVKDVIVGDPSVVDVVIRNKNTAYLFARGIGQTNVFFFAEDGRQIMNIDLEVALDGKAVQKAISRSIKGSKIKVDTLAGDIVLSGTAKNAVEATLAVDIASRFSGGAGNVVNAMRIAAGDQVMLKVRIVEMKRSVTKQLGINLVDFAVNLGKLNFEFTTENGGGTGSPGDPPANGIYGKFAFGNDLTTYFRALESNGVVRTLAEPNLTAVSGGAASFLAGGQVPICGSRDEVGNCIITYKDFGVSLSFEPRVLDEGRIALKIITEVSKLGENFGETGIPTFDSRSAKTMVELPSGGSMMLAGLIQDTDQQDINGTPGLKNLPVLGALFRSRGFVRGETELVVLVTAYIVGPSGESEFATPADRFGPATDGQANLLGRLNRIYGTAGKHPNGVYHGKVGHIIE